MLSCHSCGAEVSETARFCPVCGSSLAGPCPRCGAQTRPSARFCDSCGAPLTVAQALNEERKVVTILFADITGSTALGEQLDPERMRSLLRTYFAAMSAVIESWGGRLEKFIGDAVMAAFGVPVAREDDAERALHAALEMLERLEELNVSFRERHGVVMQIRIGVNTGEVIAPVEGEQLIVAGDAANVAARLEQAAEPGTVLVGETTYAAARHAFEFDPPAALALKGKGEPVTARRVTAVAADPSRGRGGLRAELIGRDRELRTLVDLLDEAVETERPRMVLLNGPAGIGKSRLVQEFVRSASIGNPDTVVLRGRCLPAGHGITYWALGEILRSFAGISLDDPADVAQAKLNGSVGDGLTSLELTEDERARTTHALAMTAGLSLPDNPLASLEPDAVAAELARAWPRFLSARAAASPTVVVIEDVHWAGDQLIEMLDRLLTRSSGPLLILVTARPEFAEAHPRFGAGREGASVVSLRPLTEQQSADLISGLLDAAVLPTDLRDQILGKAEGNPFFVEEMLRRLIDESALVHESGTWRTTGAAASVALPASVHALLAARIDALPGQEKRVLQEASVIGRVFWEAPVEKSAGDGAVGPALLALEQRGLVLARPTTSIAGEQEYIFKHALVRDVAYASLPKARRARAHADAGAWIEALAGDRIEEFAELVADHYHTAVAGEDSDLAWEEDDAGREEVRRKAFDALIAAGRGARRRYAISKALELHESALQIAIDDDERAAALEELGDDHYSIYHGDEAIAAQRQALEAASGPNARDRRVRLADKIGRSSSRWGAFRARPDPAWVEDVVAHGLDEAHDDETRASLLNLRARGFIFWSTSSLPDPIPSEQRIAWATEALAIAGRIGDPELITSTIFTLSGLHWERAEFRQALDVSLRRLPLLDQLTREQQAETLTELTADALYTAGDADHAVELAERAHNIALETSDHQLMHTTSGLMRALFWVGRWGEIPALIDEHLAAFAKEADMACPDVQIGPPFAARFFAEVGDLDRAAEAAALVRPLVGDQARARKPFIADLLAQYALARQRPDEAVAATDDLTADAQPWELREVAGTRIDALAALQRWSDVRALMERVRPFLDTTPLLEPITERAEAQARAAAGDRAGAVEGLRRAAAGFERLKHPFELARTRELLAEHVDPDEADTLRRAALGTYEALGAAPHVARVQSLLAEATAT